MSQLTTMTLELPTELIQETEQLINSGKIQGINDLIIRALKRELARLKQEEIKPLKGKVISYENPFDSAVNENDWEVLA